MREGTDSWDAATRLDFPGLTSWRGIGPLKADLRKLAGADPDLPLLMVNRSAQLMRFAARLLFQRCRNVLVTDLGWPPYRQLLEQQAARAQRRITEVAIAPLLPYPQSTEADLVTAIADQFRQSDADGLFLTAVSHQGIRIPVERIVRELEGIRELRFVVIDGAQDFCHTFGSLETGMCDLYLAGCHKWLGGFHPMGLGFYGRRSSRGLIETQLQQFLAAGVLDDPLLRFTTQLETTCLDGESETVNLIPLFTCQGAVSDALAATALPPTRLATRRRNAGVVAEWAGANGWLPQLPAAPFQTGILLLQAERSATRETTARDLRQRFGDCGVALTAYELGLFRLSLPETEWQDEQVEDLQAAFVSLA